MFTVSNEVRLRASEQLQSKIDKTLLARQAKNERELLRLDKQFAIREEKLTARMQKKEATMERRLLNKHMRALDRIHEAKRREAVDRDHMKQAIKDVDYFRRALIVKCDSNVDEVRDVLSRVSYARKRKGRSTHG